MSQRVPWAHARVVKASKRLSSTDKLIWLEHVALAHGDNGSACISAKGLGGRVGLARVTVERARQEFLRCGLISKRERGPGRTDEWTPCLPRSCRPTGQRLTDDELEHFAELLDAHLASLDKSEGGSAGGTNLTPPVSDL